MGGGGGGGGGGGVDYCHRLFGGSIPEVAYSGLLRCNTSAALKSILRGFECVLNDEDFKINSPKAKCAIETAHSLMSWSSREEKRQRACKSTRINATNTKLCTIKTEALS